MKTARVVWPALLIAIILSRGGSAQFAAEFDTPAHDQVALPSVSSAEITDTCLLLRSYESSGTCRELPSLGFGEEYYFVEITSPYACSLAAARFRIYDPWSEGEPSVRVQVFGTDGVQRNGRMYPSENDAPYGGPNRVGVIDIRYDELVFWPQWNVVDLRQFGPYPLEAGDAFFLTLGMTPGSIEEGNTICISGEANISHDSVQFCHTGIFRHEGDSTAFRYISELTQDGDLGAWFEIAVGAFACSGSSCYCTHRSDIDRSGFVDATDLNAVIGMAYFGEEYPGEPLCAWHPADLDLNGVIDAIDVHLMLSYVFMGGIIPELPCSGP